MKDILKGIKPIEVMKHFEELTRIPRESGNEKAVSDFLVDFAKENNITLIDGNGLINLLQKHGFDFHIDLEQAKILNKF
jgi:dipeptidase D